jgi:hypothetical protein
MNMGSTYAALSVLDAAINRTKSLLWPFKLGLWLRIAVISFFVGGTGAGFNFHAGGSSPGGVPGVNILGVGNSLLSNVVFNYLLIVAAILIFVLAMWLLGAIFQFVFVDCLRTGEVSLRRYFGPRTGKGFSLFLFQLGLGLIIFLIIAVPVALLILAGGGFASGVPSLAVIPGFLLLFAAILLIALFMGLIMLFTIDFVVPIMIRDDCGVIDGWHTCWGIIRTEWKQALVYAITKFLLGIATGIIMLIVVIIAALVIAIPFVIIGILAAGAGGSVPINITLLVLFFVVMLPVGLLISVPFVTFLRYYSLEVLAAIAPAYDLLPAASPAE